MITAKILHRIKDRKLAYLHQFMQESQRWPIEKIRRFQFLKIKRLLNHAYQHVPYYRNVFTELKIKPEDIRSFSDFSRLPVLTKDIIRQDIHSFISQNTAQEDLVPNATGGSTGEPLHFFQDKRYEDWAYAARIRGWYHFPGCEAGDACAVLWGAMIDIKEDFSIRERAEQYFKSGTISLNAFNLSDDRKRSFYHMCRWGRPKLIIGYVSAVREFAHYLKERGLNIPSLKGVVLCAETVTEETQSYLNRIFRAPSYNAYGGRELSLIAMECPEHHGLHEISENNFVEFEPIDLAGIQGAGNLIITNLNNHAMPFIRYRIGDIGIQGALPDCPCGRGLPRISKVIGRTTEILEFYDGTKIAGEMFIHLMKDFPLKQYQFIQKSDRLISLRYPIGDLLDQGIREKIVDTYKNYLPGNVAITFDPVDHLDKTPTGKFRFVLKQP